MGSRPRTGIQTGDEMTPKRLHVHRSSASMEISVVHGLMIGCGAGTLEVAEEL